VREKGNGYGYYKNKTTVRTLALYIGIVLVQKHVYLPAGGFREKEREQ
tara:strand:+ start:131 stop:274 length:144 start_codon:yes stop_codon:yes gene_type:complete